MGNPEQTEDEAYEAEVDATFEAFYRLVEGFTHDRSGSSARSSETNGGELGESVGTSWDLNSARADARTREAMAEAIFDTLVELLRTVRLQLQAVASEEWLAKQSAGELAELLGTDAIEPFDFSLAYDPPAPTRTELERAAEVESASRQLVADIEAMIERSSPDQVADAYERLLCEFPHLRR